MVLRRGEMGTANEGVSASVDAMSLAVPPISFVSLLVLRTVGMPMSIQLRSATSVGAHAPPNLRGQDPRLLVCQSEPISTLWLSSSPNFHARSHNSLDLHPSRGLVKENTSYYCHGMLGAADCGECG